MQHFLYIARPLNELPGIFKVGRTSRAPARRCRELGGQSTQSFELLAAYPTRDGVLAELLAHGRLDAKGARLRPRKELFRGELTAIQQVCEASVKAADAVTVQTQASVEAPAPATSAWLLPDTAFWQGLGAYPVRHQSCNWRLSELLVHAVRNEPAARRLRVLGFDKVFFSTERVEFRVQPNGAVHEFIAARSLSAELADNTLLVLTSV